MHIDIGIDVGGTFTDAIVLDGGSGVVLDAFKLPSTRDDPGKAVLEALGRISERFGVLGARVFHGTTVGTNTLIERKGVRTVLVTTAGFADVIELRRQNRPELYRWDVRVSVPLVPRSLRFEVLERLDHYGAVISPLTGIEALVADLVAAAPDAVAISCLHAYANPMHEVMLRDAIAKALPEAFVTCSHEVCPELGEYERASTTVVNAYIGPVVSHYLRQLDTAVKAQGVSALTIVKSNGGLTSIENAARFPVHLIESGPAAGIIAASAYARASDRSDLIVYDMGGTTAKTSVVQGGQPVVAREFHADRYVGGRDEGGHTIRSTVLDVVEIGAGGGSIASIDAGGVVKVGPQSAGAEPGPACYGRGGTLPTVTDAHAVIGTLAPETFDGSGVHFDRNRAVDALQTYIADPMGWSLDRAAYAVIDIATARMSEMVRMATVHRGLDPRDFTLLASGGAGPLHASRIASDAGIKTVVIPPLPGMFSALGALMGDIRHDLTQAALRRLDQVEPEEFQEGFSKLQHRAADFLSREVLQVGQRSFQRYLDMRFQGQLFELRVPVGCVETELPTRDEAEQRFRAAYCAEFGFDLPQSKVQVVRLNLTAQLRPDILGNCVFRDAKAAMTAPEAVRRQPFLGRDGKTFQIRVHRSGPVSGRIEGPALIEHSGSTVWIESGQSAEFQPDGSILLEV